MFLTIARKNGKLFLLPLLVQVWDMRQQKAVMESTDCEEFISDMAVERNKRLLLATRSELIPPHYNLVTLRKPQSHEARFF